MSRPRYPSDDLHNERRSPASFRLHTSFQNHPKTVDVYANNDLFAMYNRIGLVCRDRGIAETNDRLYFSEFDLMRFGGTILGADGEPLRGASRAVRRRFVALCEALQWEYTLPFRGARGVLHFRNFARKQGFTPRKSRSTTPDERKNSAQTPHSPSPSPSVLKEPTADSANRPRASKGSETENDQEFEEFWTHYPKRLGDNPKIRARRAWNARLREGVTAEEILAGEQRYQIWIKVTGKEETEMVKQAATFLGPDRAFREAWTLPINRERKQNGRRWILSDGTSREFSAMQRIRVVDNSDAMPFYEAPDGTVLLASGARRAE